jgi:acetamidase/formamidase
MCFAHSGNGLLRQTAIGPAAAAAFWSVSEGGGGGSAPLDVPGSGTPATTAGPGDPRVLDGFGQVLHNRWNRDLPAAATVQPGEEIQLLCRDALDIGEAARTLTADGILTLDLSGVHPLTGPVEVAGAEPGDIVEVEVLDVAPLVDFGYAAITPGLGMFGSLRPDTLAPFTVFTEPSQISDPSPGTVPGAIPADQPYNSGAPFVQLFSFERGQNAGFASFTGADTGRQARIPITPFMGIYGVAPMRKGMFRTLPPGVSGGMGGNADIRQFVKGSRIQFPVYAEGAKFSAGDGHMAQGDGEVCVTGIETLMAVTVRFSVIKNTVIAGPRAIVPAADPTQQAMTAEMLGAGYYHTTGTGPDMVENARNAVRDMVDWLAADQGLSLHEAYVLCSVAGDLKISEVVDVPHWVVSMTLPRGIFV